MKKKIWKIVALVTALTLILVIASFANSLVGNPVSKFLARRGAEKYLEENYAQTDYYLEDLGFNFKFVCYYAHIASESSGDTRFSLRIDMLGRVYHDTYEDVTSGFITASRLDQEYRTLTDRVFDDPSFPFARDIGYGTLEIHGREYIGTESSYDIPHYSLVREDLILDHLYDIRELGARAGHLIVYVDSDTVTVEKAAEIMLEIRKLFDEAGVPFRAMDFTLQLPRPEDGPREEVYVRARDFPYADIYAEGMTERVAAAEEAVSAYYAELDSQK